MEGVELAARFSYITNILRYCGPEEASERFVKYFEKESSKEELIASLKKFEGLYPYLNAIAKKSGKEFYDYSVVEAYWIGNKLLDEFEKEDILEIIRSLVKRGLPKTIGDKLIETMPDGFIPHHNFNVIFVGVGNITGAVEVTIQNMDNCRISYGKVLEILSDKLIVSTKPLDLAGKKIVYGQEETKTAVYLPVMFPNLKVGDIVALHWGFACMVLNEEQQKNLESYTQKIIDIRNSLV